MTLSAARWQCHRRVQLRVGTREALDWLSSQLPDRDPGTSGPTSSSSTTRARSARSMPWSLAGRSVPRRDQEPPGRADRRRAQLDLDHRWPIDHGRQPSHPRQPQSQAPGQPAQAAAGHHKPRSACPSSSRRSFSRRPACPVGSKGWRTSATFQRGRPGALDDPGIVGALANGVTNRSLTTVDSQQARHRRGPHRGRHPPLQQAPPGGRLPAGQSCCRREKGFQDWEAQHVSIDTVHRRVRIYPVHRVHPRDPCATRVQARREFEILEGIDHPAS